MSLKPQDYVVPKETAELARAILPEGNLVVNLFDELGVIFEDKDFADLYPHDGQPALSPVRLALATILQFGVFVETPQKTTLRIRKSSLIGCHSVNMCSDEHLAHQCLCARVVNETG